jgi:hypothetical protein
MDGIVLVLIVIPHIALGVAWVYWGRCPGKFEDPWWQTSLLFAGLLGCSLNIVLFWAYVNWLRLHNTDPSGWKGRDNFEVVSDFLIVFALVAAICEKGRARPPLLVAAVFGWFIWVTGHLGI